MGRVSQSMQPKRLLLGLAGVLSLLFTVAPASVLASCAEIPTVREAVGTADVVFVGTVSATAQNNAWATVSVEEVWKGPDLPAIFQVRGGPGGNSVTSVDRAFEVGTRYLFVPFGMEDTFASDNSCSATQPWDDSLAALRPADSRGPIGGAPPAPAAFDLVGALLPFGVALLVAGVLVAVGLVARSRRSD